MGKQEGKILRTTDMNQKSVISKEYVFKVNKPFSIKIFELDSVL